MQFGIQFCLYLLACGLVKANILGDDREPARFQPDDTVQGFAVVDLAPLGVNKYSVFALIRCAFTEHTFELISLNEEKVTDDREPKADFRTCKPPSDFGRFPLWLGVHFLSKASDPELLYR